MNTETRKHAEKSGYRRKGKYREDLMDDEEVEQMREAVEDDGGVLSDYPDDQSEDDRDPPASEGRR